MTNQDSRFLNLAKGFMPTPSSIIYGVIISIAIVFIHIVAQSLSFGTFLPDIFQGAWATLYTNSIVQPLETVIHNSAVQLVVTLLLWGIAGLIVSILVEHAFKTYAGWGKEEDEVQMIDSQHLIAHPNRDSYVFLVAWRITIGGLATGFFIVTLPTMKWLLNIDSQLFNGAVTTAKVSKIGIEILGWAVIIQFVVIFMRLYLRRYRLGQEIIQLRG